MGSDLGIESPKLRLGPMKMMTFLYGWQARTVTGFINNGGDVAILHHTFGQQRMNMSRGSIALPA